MPALDQRFGDMRADKACSPGHEDIAHAIYLLC